MAERGGQRGNHNAKRGAEYRQALRRAMARRSGTVGEALIEIAGKCIEAAMNGAQWAIKKIADRFDGKPAQSLTVSGDQENPIYGSGLAELYVGAKAVPSTGEAEADRCSEIAPGGSESKLCLAVWRVLGAVGIFTLDLGRRRKQNVGRIVTKSQQSL